MKTKQAGFTLVEIAIVLVIIGLLLGGILKGQEMITQAKIKNVDRRLLRHLGRLLRLPGPLSRHPGRRSEARRAGRRYGRATATAYGQRASTTATTATDESALWWDHLRRAGFVAGAGATSSRSTPSPACSACRPATAGGAVGALGGFGSLIMCSADLPDKIAIAVDTQMDDGLPRHRHGSRASWVRVARRYRGSGRLVVRGDRHQRHIRSAGQF